LLTILVVATVSNAQMLERQTCITTRSSVDVDMADASAVIGGLFEMRRSILGGYACGGPHKGMNYCLFVEYCYPKVSLLAYHSSLYS
jgi:hypothetical protein